MTPERAAELVARWVRLYTRSLPAPIARRRADELAADLHDHIACERARGVSDRRIALAILSRMLRGFAADLAWRGHQAATERDPRRRTALGAVTRVALGTALVLSVPLVAMRLTGDVAWGPADFAVAGALLAGAGLIRELAVRRVRDIAYRAAVAVGLGAGLLLVWGTLAVGVVGEPDARANAVYLAVPAVGLLGACLARLRAEGMARALQATAFAQALAGVLTGIGAPAESVVDVVALNAVFVGLFAASAWLFRRAARRRSPSTADPAG